MAKFAEVNYRVVQKISNQRASQQVSLSLSPDIDRFSSSFDRWIYTTKFGGLLFPTTCSECDSTSVGISAHEALAVVDVASADTLWVVPDHPLTVVLAGAAETLQTCNVYTVHRALYTLARKK